MRRSTLAASLSVLTLSAAGCVDEGRMPAVPAPPLPSATAADPVLAAALTGPGHPLQSWMATSAGAPVETRVAVTARPIRHEGHQAIAFTVRNVSGGRLTLWPTMLPWGDVHAIDVLGLTPTGEPLIWSGPIVDPGPQDPFQLASGESRSGIATLDSLPGLEAQLRATDVLVLWRYDLRLDDGVGMTTGALVFPRRRSDTAVPSR